MKQADAKDRILAIWRKHAEYSQRSRSPVRQRFYMELETEHPELLRFRSKDDPWQVVSIWIERG